MTKNLNDRLREARSDLLLRIEIASSRPVKGAIHRNDANFFWFTESKGSVFKPNLRFDKPTDIYF